MDITEIIRKLDFTQPESLDMHSYYTFRRELGYRGYILRRDFPPDKESQVHWGSVHARANQDGVDLLVELNLEEGRMTKDNFTYLKLNYHYYLDEFLRYYDWRNPTKNPDNPEWWKEVGIVLIIFCLVAKDKIKEIIENMSSENVLHGVAIMGIATGLYLLINNGRSNAQKNTFQEKVLDLSSEILYGHEAMIKALEERTSL